jgi:hypothetical protein
VLVQEVRRLGGVIQLDSEVTGIDFSKPAVHIKGLPNILPDLIISADSLKSVYRESFLDHSNPPRFSDDIAYHCIIQTEKVRQCSSLKDILQSSVIHY